MILKFTSKIVQKEWKKLMLPFLSVLLTAAVVTTSFFLIDSAKNFISSKNLEILGGDIVFESARPIDVSGLLNKDLISKSTSQLSFSGMFTVNKDGEIKNSNASFNIIDNNYPLYGKLVLQNGNFVYPKANQVYVDQNIANSLGLTIGEIISFNNKDFAIIGIVTEDPESLIPNFNFSGKLYLAKESLGYAGVDLSLFRKEFSEKFVLSKKFSEAEIKSLRDIGREQSVRVKTAGSGQNGFMFGLEVVEKFLVVTILVLAILSLVNIYASVNYLATRLRRSFAILISIGMNMSSLYKILFLVNLSIILLGSILGISLGYLIAKEISIFVSTRFDVELIITFKYLEILFMFAIILLTSIFATFPVLNRLRKLSPKELLSHGENPNNSRTSKSILFDILIGILPITVLSIYFLESFLFGALTILGIVVVYGGLMFFYYYFVNLVYKNRNIFNFPLKMITAQKKFDGFFGLISFASLFVALAAIYNLSIVRTSLDDYLRKDLSRTLPSTYVLDVQSSQAEKIKENYSNITLFPNIRARIINIDGLDIVKELEQQNPNIDRELGREFNLSYRKNLLESEQISDTLKGKSFESMSVGEVSVEKDFAAKSGIKIGSEVVFLIQGIQIKALVTTLREVDTRSGFPFFYFVFSEEALRDFPKTFFGYANFDKTTQNNFKSYLSGEFPNISVIDTSNITGLAEKLINVLLLIILIITFPPLLLSSMLIITILASVAKERKRDGARLMALGKTNIFIRNYYILESISTTFLASMFAYIFALQAANFVIVKYLKIDNLVLFDFVSFYIFLFIIFGILCVSVLLWKAGKKTLREYLNYEENN